MKKKNKVKLLILYLLFFASLLSFSYSLFNIIQWKLDCNKTDKRIEVIQNNVIIEDITNNDNIEIIENNEIIVDDYYSKYINMNLISVNFDELKNINDETIGWIQVKGTNVNYPFVQTSNNYFYLNHSFDKTKNEAGWVFMDYRNNIKNENKNTILYAHARLDKTMFGSLRNALKSNWFNNLDNHVVRLSNEYENTLWQIFSIYHIETTSDYIETNFNNSEFNSFINLISSRSIYSFNTSVNENDRILTLSTCYNKTEKLVLHAKLIKREVR